MRGGRGRDFVDATDSDRDTIFTGEGRDVVKDGFGHKYFELGSEDDRIIFQDGGVKTVMTGDGSDRIKIKSIDGDNKLVASVNDFTPGEDSIKTSVNFQCSLESLSRGRFVQCGSTDDSSISVGLSLGENHSLLDKSLALGLALSDSGLVKKVEKSLILKNYSFDEVDQFLENVEQLARENFLEYGIYRKNMYKKLSRGFATKNAAKLMKSVLPDVSTERLETVVRRSYQSENDQLKKSSNNISRLRKAGATLISAVNRLKSDHEDGVLDVTRDATSEGDPLISKGHNVSTTIQNSSSLDVFNAIVQNSLSEDELMSEVSFYGSALDDRLIGNSSSNIISGGDGDDTISGRGGDDYLIGGPGADTFKISKGNDVIVDFEKGIDRIDAKNMVFGMDFVLEDFVGPTGLPGVRIIADPV